MSSDLMELGRRSLEDGTAETLTRCLSFFTPDAVWDFSAVGLGTFNAPRSVLDDAFAAYAGIETKAGEVPEVGNRVSW